MNSWYAHLSLTFKNVVPAIYDVYTLWEPLTLIQERAIHRVADFIC
jgi:hypothetical protein